MICLARLIKRPIWFLSLLTLMNGCADELGPEQFRTTKVTGKVRIGSTPVGGGFIEFLPVGGTVGLMRSGPIHPDGTFVVNRVPVGENAVGLFGGSLPRGFSVRFNTLSTPIRRTFRDAPSSTTDLDLLVEEVLYQKAAARSAVIRNR